MKDSNKGMVLVTGVSGYVGLHCAAELLNEGYNVRSTLRNLNKSPNIIDSLKKVSDRTECISFVEVDLLNDNG